MSRPHLPNAVRQRIFVEAHFRCGYCHAQQDVIGMQLHIEHIIPISVGGSSELENLWLACSECNNHKGSQTHREDPVSGEHVAIFNPRVQDWREHFCWSDDGVEIIGLTAVGRVTVLALDLNQPNMVRARRRWVMVGWHPPKD
jgi:hypothetical protein